MSRQWIELRSFIHHNHIAKFLFTVGYLCTFVFRIFFIMCTDKTRWQWHQWTIFQTQYLDKHSVVSPGLVICTTPSLKNSAGCPSSNSSCHRIHQPYRKLTTLTVIYRPQFSAAWKRSWNNWTSGVNWAWACLPDCASSADLRSIWTRRRPVSSRWKAPCCTRRKR